MEPLTGGASVSERPASFLDSIRAEAVGTLLAEDGWLLAAVLGAAVTGVLVWAALPRVRRGAEAVAVVRPVLALTSGMAGVLWVSWRLDGRTFYFLGALLVFFWLVTLTALGARLVVWVGRRATSRWSNVSADAACAVDRGELDRRIALEASRLQGEGERSLCIAAIGVRHKRRTGRRIWEQAVQLALPHYAVHRIGDGTVIVMMPDATRSQLRRWISHFNASGTDAMVGWAIYPADGQSAEQLLESAQRSLRGTHGRVPGGLGPRPMPSAARRADPESVANED